MEPTKYVKVTIIIEDDESVSTTTFPTACDVQVENRSHFLDGSWPSARTFVADIIDFGFNFTALFNGKAGYVSSTQIVQKEVADEPQS